MRCSECGKSSHKDCSAMIPCFCGLAPEMADILVAAFEDFERKLIQKEIEDAEKSRMDTPIFEPSDLTGLNLGSALAESLPFLKDAIGNLQISNSSQIDPSAPYHVGSVSTASILSTSLSANESKTSRKEDTKIRVEDFHFIAVLGRGAFGKVMLAKDKKTGQMYAIKALKKDYIIQNDDINRYDFSFNSQRAIGKNGFPASKCVSSPIHA